MDYNDLMTVKDFGEIHIKLKAVMDAKKITPYRLSKLSGINHHSILSYYNNDTISRFDLDVLARLCYILKCQVSDILEYKEPIEMKNSKNNS